MQGSDNKKYKIIQEYENIPVSKHSEPKTEQLEGQEGFTNPEEFEKYTKACKKAV